MQVFGFDNPVTALVEFKPNFYDLLLIDVNMPLMDGFQLAQNLVRRDLNVRVCFMTSEAHYYRCTRTTNQGRIRIDVSLSALVVS